MNREQFCFWLTGVLEVNDELTPEQVKLVKDRLEDAINTPNPVTPIFPPHSSFDPIGPCYGPVTLPNHGATE